MSFINLPFCLLIMTTILILSLLLYIRKSKKNEQINVSFTYIIVCILIISIGVICQSIGKQIFNIDPINFENIIYIGTCFLPVFLFLCSLVFSNSKIIFNKKHFILFIVPIISLLTLWTNKFHHLFYVEYSSNISETIYGKYFYVHTFYTYILFVCSLVNFLHYSIKNAGFFSKQSLLIVIGALIPIVVNVLGTLKIIPMSV